jgi:hypothetical protein
MTRKHVGALVVAAAAVAGSTAGLVPTVEAGDNGVRRGRTSVVGTSRGPYHRNYWSGRWGGGYYRFPYHRYHRFGWGLHFGPYYDPYFAPYAYGPPGGIDMNVAVLAGLGAIDVDVKPSKADVWVDGRYVAQARDLDGYPSFLWLPEGVHRVAIYRKGYLRFEQEIEVKRGIRKELEVRLVKGESEPPGQELGEER